MKRLSIKFNNKLKLFKLTKIRGFTSSLYIRDATFNLQWQWRSLGCLFLLRFEMNRVICCLPSWLECNAGPKSRATHWKQTVLYLEDVLTVCQGEAVVGTMTVAQNEKNPRDVDITLKYSLNGRHCQASRTQHYRMRWSYRFLWFLTLFISGWSGSKHCLLLFRTLWELLIPSFPHDSCWKWLYVSWSSIQQVCCKIQGGTEKCIGFNYFIYIEIVPVLFNIFV